MDSHRCRPLAAETFPRGGWLYRGIEKRFPLGAHSCLVRLPRHTRWRVRVHGVVFHPRAPGAMQPRPLGNGKSRTDLLLAGQENDLVADDIAALGSTSLSETTP